MEQPRRQAIHDAMVRRSDGDRRAFDALLDELWPVILSFVERGVGRGADAEDVAQEVFYRISSRISDFDRSRASLSWAFGIASYELMTHRKRVPRRREVNDEHALASEDGVAQVGKADQSASQEALLVRRELSLALEQALEALPEPEREALGLVAHERASSLQALRFAALSAHACGAGRGHARARAPLPHV